MVTITERSQWTILSQHLEPNVQSAMAVSKSLETGSISVGSVQAVDEIPRVNEPKSSISVEPKGIMLPLPKKNDVKKRKKLKRVAGKLILRYSSSEIEDEDFYHGYMTRTEAERLLSTKGQFLLRKTEVRGELCYVLSVFDQAKVRHLRVRMTGKSTTYWLNDYSFESIGALVNFHCVTGHPVHPDGLFIVKYVKRESWELYHEQIDLSGGKLGSGEFGEVMAGFLRVGFFSAPIPVAVKTLRGENMSSDDRVTFLREANVMLQLKHEHVVRLYGVATQKQPIMIVMERASGGSLLSRLRKEQKASVKMKERFVIQIVEGMAYLEHKEVIHRDLAARNVLLSGDKCKISDFGLSLIGKLHKEKKLSKVPVRWLAPETLTQGVYSSKTDVWSFGVVVYEIFSNGDVPYGEDTNLRIVAQKVRRGDYLQPHPGTTPRCAEIMKRCFQKSPETRTSFGALKNEYGKSSIFDRVYSLFH